MTEQAKHSAGNAGMYRLIRAFTVQLDEVLSKPHVHCKYKYKLTQGEFSPVKVSFV